MKRDCIVLSELVVYKSGKKCVYFLVCWLLRNNWDVNIIFWKLCDLFFVWLKSFNMGDNFMWFLGFGWFVL